MKMYLICITGFGNGKGDRRCQILGVLRPHAERLEDCVRRGDTRGTVPRSASEAKAQMFPSIILNVSLFARWYWNVLKCLVVSSPVYQSNRSGEITEYLEPQLYQPTSAKRLQTSPASTSAQNVSSV